MIAVVVLAVCALGLIGVFNLAQTGIQVSKNKSLASNLAQEKMQILKQKNYYDVVATPDPSYNSEVSPPIPYDTVYFPPETILEGGISFTRLTYVIVGKEDSGTLVALAPTTPDTGMKFATVSVLWTQGGTRRKLQVSSVIANPNSTMSNAIFYGSVRDCTTSGPISGALVSVAENSGWRDTAGASGSYSVDMSPGSYTLMASYPGYFTTRNTIKASPNASTQKDFCLIKMATGTVTGTAWINSNILISQVVVSTAQAGSTYPGEYIELFNPTTSSILLNGRLNLAYSSNHNNMSCQNIPLTFVNNSIAATSYFLISNMAGLTINGAALTADATFDDSNPAIYCSGVPADWTRPLMLAGRNGCVAVLDGSFSMIDYLGWSDASQSPPYCEGTCIPLSAGLAAGEQIVRASSPSFASSSYGRAYDSGNNSADFAYPPSTSGIQHSPRCSADGGQAVLAGVPAIGAFVTANDGLSVPATAYAVGSPPRADFSLPNVATATASAPWTVVIASGLFYLQNDTVTLPSNGSVYNFPSSTTLLRLSGSNGFISGTVTDAAGSAISAPSAISVSPASAGADSTASPSTGKYLLRVAPGLVDVTANPNNLNASYMAASSNSISVGLGQIHSGVDFTLSQGGRITGFVTRDGTNGLPGIGVVALDFNEISHDQPVSDVNGRFTTVTITTGVYTVKPVLGSLQSSSPSEQSVTILPGQTVFSATFTITGALGTIRGSVSASGSPISTGVLLVVTTATLPGSPPAPPALSSASLTAAAYYLASSLEDGTYSLDVRQGSYIIYGYYPTVNASGAVTINAQSRTSVTVTAGQTTSGQDFSW
jgi:hypothetical protein